MHGGGAINPEKSVTPEENEVIECGYICFLVYKTKIDFSSQKALRNGVANLRKHVSNGVKYGVPLVVAINAMQADTENEWKIIRDASIEAGAVDAIVTTHWQDGGSGAIKLAETVITASQQPQQFKYVIYKKKYPK